MVNIKYNNTQIGSNSFSSLVSLKKKTHTFESTEINQQKYLGKIHLPIEPLTIKKQLLSGLHLKLM